MALNKIGADMNGRLPNKENDVDWLSKSLKVEVLKDSDMITIKLPIRDRQLAVALVNAVARSSVEFLTSNRAQQLTSELNSLRNSTERYSQEMSVLRERIRSWEEQSNPIDDSGERSADPRRAGTTSGLYEAQMRLEITQELYRDLLVKIEMKKLQQDSPSEVRILALAHVEEAVP